MAKIKLHRLHKVKIHKNRWLIWAVAYVVFVAIALTGYIKVTDINFDSQLAENSLQAGHNYKDSRLGFSVRYPMDWSIEADSDSSITFAPNDLSQDGVTVTVTTLTAEKAIRKALKISSETTISLDSVPAQKILNIANGLTETVVLAQHNRQLYVLRGEDSLVGKLLLTFNFIE